MTGIEIEVALEILGFPAPKGSLKCVGRGGKHRLVEDNPRTSSWRDAVADAAVANGSRAEIQEPIGVEITTSLPRPQHHYGATGLLPSAPHMPTYARTGDVDKLARLVLDALVDARLLVDDSQVVELVTRKTYVDDHRPWTPDALDQPGQVVRVYPMTL